MDKHVLSDPAALFFFYLNAYRRLLTTGVFAPAQGLLDKHKWKMRVRLCGSEAAPTQLLTVQDHRQLQNEVI